MMFNSFRQPQNIYKICFQTQYKYIGIFDELSIENILSLSSFELQSETIDSMDDDLWGIELYLSDVDNFPAIKRVILEFARDRNVFIINDDVVLEKIEDQDWVSFYNDSLEPIIIRQFFISSGLHQNLCPYDKIGIVINASRAFGTGFHETTSGCIESMSELSAKSIQKILDIGTGSGILSFAAEKIWPAAKIIGCDIDRVSVDIATDNAKINNSKAIFYQNTDDEILPSMVSEKFDLIVSNILSKPLIRLCPSVSAIADADAYVILSGFLDNQAQEIICSYKAYNFSLVKLVEKNRWCVATLQFKV